MPEVSLIKYEADIACKAGVKSERNATVKNRDPSRIATIPAVVRLSDKLPGIAY
jgi:hypothetical protein